MIRTAMAKFGCAASRRSVVARGDDRGRAPEARGQGDADPGDRPDQCEQRHDGRGGQGRYRPGEAHGDQRHPLERGVRGAGRQRVAPGEDVRMVSPRRVRRSRTSRSWGTGRLNSRPSVHRSCTGVGLSDLRDPVGGHGRRPRGRPTASRRPEPVPPAGDGNLTAPGRLPGRRQEPERTSPTGGRSSTCCLERSRWMPPSTPVTGADGDGHLLPSPQVALLEQQVGRVVAGAVDHQPADRPDGPVRGMDRLAPAHLHLVERDGVVGDGLRARPR